MPVLLPWPGGLAHPAILVQDRGQSDLMHETLQFVVRHGYLLVFAWVFVEQAGLPIPSAPLLLAVGALAGTHQMNLGLAMTCAVVAALASDATWYELGRR